MTFQWFISKTVRHASSMRKHVHKILCAQRDILSPPAIEAVQGAINELQASIRRKATKSELLKQMENVEQAANKWLKPYPHAAWRENIEVLLVALAVAMGIRTFFIQPFKIPTGSMQPTLYGITSTPDLTRLYGYDTPDDLRRLNELGGNNDTFEIPSGMARISDWFAGNSYVIFRAKEDGVYEGMSRPFRFLIFNIKQTLWFSEQPHTLWFPPDTGGGPSYQSGGLLGMFSSLFTALPADQQYPTDLERRMNLRRGKHYSKGQDVIRIKVKSGDHLFVDRLTYNFRKPQRGEIIVFATKGTPIEQQDQFYIKRMVAMGGEKVQIGNDRHLIINGERLTASVPHFENVYSFDANEPPRESQYSGHVNEFVANQYGFRGIAPIFPSEDAVYTVDADKLMVMGDNTLNSSDSRSWGDFSANNVIGKSFFIYWPITSRFGVGHR